MYIEYNSGVVMYDLKTLNRRPIRVDVAVSSYYTNELRHGSDGGCLVATSDTSISNSICLTHNNSDNWHGSNSSSSGQILFSNGDIYIRSSSGKIISISNYFYMQNLDSESGSNVGNSYVVIDRTTGKLYNRPITTTTNDPHKIINNQNNGYLYFTKYQYDDASVCITHNNNYNWHGLGNVSPSSGQILFTNGTISIRSTNAVQFVVSEAFYMYNVSIETGGEDVANSYLVYKSGNGSYSGKLYSRPLRNPTVVSNNRYVGYLSFTKYQYDDASVCITHNNNYNWHGLGNVSPSSGQILFTNGTISIRSTNAVQFVVSEAFYMYSLASERAGDEGDAYVVINVGTKKLYYYYTGSDDRRKHNEVKINNALETIMKLEGFRYDMTETMYPIDYNGEIKDNYRKEAGFIAQSVLKIDELKFTVKGGDYLDNSNNLVEKSYQLNYNAIFTYSVVAIQELKRDSDNKDIIIAEQKNEIDSLKEKNLVLENKVEILKNKLNELLTESGKETINF